MTDVVAVRIIQCEVRVLEELMVGKYRNFRRLLNLYAHESEVLEGIVHNVCMIGPFLFCFFVLFCFLLFFFLLETMFGVAVTGFACS